MAEPVIQLIQIIRALHAYNNKELIDWTINASKLFGNTDNGTKLMKKVLITGLSKHYTNIPNNLFTQLVKLNNNENVTANDSINIHYDAQTFEENQISETVQKFDFVTLNEDLEMYICRFLPLSDLPNLSQTCRHFCIITHHPASISNINIDISRNKNNTNYKHNRYSRIESLTLQTNNRNKCDFNQHWNESVNLLNITDYCLDETELNSIYSDTFPVCINLNKFSYSGSLSYFWINNKINPNSVRILHLRHFIFDKDFLNTIITLTNIKELSLKWMIKFGKKEHEFSETFDEIKNFSQYKTRNNDLFPFKKLETIEYESHEFDTKNDELKLFICWILCNVKKTNATFKYTHNCSNEYDLFDSYCPLYQSQTEQFKNINQVIFKGFLCPFLLNINTISSIVGNYNQNKKFDLIDLHLTLWDQHNFRLNEYEWCKTLNLTKSLNILVKHSNNIKLRIKFFVVHLDKFNVNWFQQWAYNIMDESKTYIKQKTFDEITLIIRIQRNIAVDIIQNIITDDMKLDEFVTKFMNQIMNMMKPWIQINKQIKDIVGIKMLNVELICFETFGKEEEKQFEIDQENAKFKDKDDMKLDEIDEYNDDDDGFEDFDDDIDDYDAQYDEEIDELISKQLKLQSIQESEQFDQFEIKEKFIKCTKMLKETMMQSFSKCDCKLEFNKLEISYKI